MDLPLNLLCWGVMSLLGLMTWLCVSWNKLRYSHTVVVLFASAVLLTLPIIWTPAVGLPIAAPRLVGIWGGVLFYLTLIQRPFREKEIVSLFYLLAAASIIETLLSIAGLFFPQYLPWPLDALAYKYSGSASGIFQQRNVTSSFLATGFTVVLFLLADKRRTLADRRLETVRMLLLSGATIFISATLVLLESRIGWLGAITGFLCETVLFFSPHYRNRTSLKRQLLVIILPVAGVLLGTSLLNHSLIDSLQHEGSNHQRWLTIDYTLRMISEHPWRGYGLGMFESVYQNFMANLPFDNPSREMMQHPHNETLFIEAEGGVVALAGGMCLLWAWIMLYRRRKSLWQWAALLTTLPILLHTQVEFPLYYSVPHYFAVLLLMSASEGRCQSTRFTVKLLPIVMVTVSAYGMILAAKLFLASLALGKFEAGHLDNPENIRQLSVPWLMQMRYQRDLSLLHLNNFNQRGDIIELEMYARENKEWIILHMEENAYNDQINILYFLNQRKEAEGLKKRANLLMPWDARFRTRETINHI